MTTSTAIASVCDKLGIWYLENGLAVFKDPFREAAHYDRPSLELAIQNVKGNCDWYATHEAYERDLFHFKRGLSLFKAAPASA